MSRLRQLITEIHRRSVCQVLLVYCGGAWICYEIIEAITRRLALPEWLPALAIVLFLIGLPVVVASALIREEPSPAARSEQPQFLDIEAGKRETEAATAHYESQQRFRILTWRNSGLIFMFALAIWGIVAAGWFMFGDHEEQTVSGKEERPSIAVLPLMNRSGFQEDEYFTDGIHDEILTQLSKIRSLSVRGRTSVMRYSDSPKNMREIGDELNARYLLEGGVLRAGNKVRINVQLIDARRDEHIWAETYDRKLSIENLLAIQTEVSRRIAESLETTLTPDEEDRLAALPTTNLAAYDNYLRGRHFWNQRTLEAFDSAIQYYNRAVLLDPNFARAYAALAETYVLIPEYGGPPISEILPIARAATERALTLDPNLAEAYTALAYVKNIFERDREGAERDYVKAIELNPDYATAHQWYGELLSYTLRPDKAIAEARKAVELDPLSFTPNLMLGVVLAYSGQVDDAAEAIQKAIEIIPEHELALKWLGWIYVLRGDYKSAAPVFDRFAELTGTNPEAYRAYLTALEDPARIQMAVHALRDSGLYITALPGGSSSFLAHLRQFDEAIAVLEECYERNDPRLAWVNGHPMFENLKTNPRFLDLMKRMNLPTEYEEGRRPNPESL